MGSTGCRGSPGLGPPRHAAGRLAATGIRGVTRAWVKRSQAASPGSRPDRSVRVSPDASGRPRFSRGWFHRHGFSDTTPPTITCPGDLQLDSPAPDSYDVAFETTAGRVVLRGHRAWSPLGAARLHHLATAGYYTGAVIYRVGPTASYPGGRVVQFGLKYRF